MKLKYGCQETTLIYYIYKQIRSDQKSKETGKQYTWFFSEEGGRQEYTARAGIIISSKFPQLMEDTEPINDRPMHLTRRGTVQINIVSA